MMRRPMDRLFFWTEIVIAVWVISSVCLFQFPKAYCQAGAYYLYAFLYMGLGSAVRLAHREALAVRDGAPQPAESPAPAVLRPTGDPDRNLEPESDLEWFIRRGY